MTAVIALAVFTILSVTALLHAAWAFGMVWPAASEAMLVRTVIGTPGMIRMPPRNLTLVVALAIAAAGVGAPWAAGILDLPLPEWMRALCAPVLALVFAARGAATFLLGHRWPLTEPFRSLDRRYFAPLCLAIAGAFAVLSI